MNRDDERFENYLREFAPRPPASLPFASTAAPLWRRFAAAAVIVIAFGASVWFGRRQRPESQLDQMTRVLGVKRNGPKRVTLGQLRRLVNDPNEFDAALANASRQELPDFRESTSALRVLAKE